MKKWIFLPLICFSLTSIQFANATSGRTNSSGCHNSKKVGYHCHGAPTTSTYIPQSTTDTLKSQSIISNHSSNKKISDTDSLVQGIQIQLNALGYKAGKADGILGMNTISAIKQFQIDNDMFADGKPTTTLLVKLVSIKS